MRVRRRGRQTSVPEGELPTLAVITMARDEGTMLRRWTDYYVDQVGAESVIVVDDNSADGSTDDLPCPVLRLPYLRKVGFEGARMTMLSGLAEGLLAAYDAVLFADADEFVVADPAVHESLRHFVAARPGHRALGVLGLNVVHDVANEPPLREDQPILGQRRLAKFLPLMCKPSLKWEPARWALASHGIACPFEIDPELYMFHLKFADRDRLLASAAHRHELNVTEGRAKKTSWARSGDHMVALLEEITSDADRDAIEPFRVPGRKQRAGIVKEVEGGGVWRTVGGGQEEAMRRRPLETVDARFDGLF